MTCTGAALLSKPAVPRCGLIMVELVTGATAAWARIEGVVRELYDVVFRPAVRQPSDIGFKTDEVTRLISIDES